MILLTPELRQRLHANGRERDADHVPVVKFFNPLGEGVWLVTELDEDGETLFGVADLGEPELGSFSLSEMQSLRLPFGMGIERDLQFEGMLPISVWAEVARQTSSIRAAECVLFAAARDRRGACDALPPQAQTGHLSGYAARTRGVPQCDAVRKRGRGRKGIS